MNLSEAEKRMIYQVEGTSQGAALNEIYMTWRYAPDKAMKDTAEGLLKKLRPLSDKECMDVIRDVQKNYRLPSQGKDYRGNVGGGQAAIRCPEDDRSRYHGPGAVRSRYPPHDRL